MSQFNFQNRQFYDISDGQINFAMDIASQAEILPVPLKKISERLLSTCLDSGFSDHKINTSQGMENEDRAHKKIEPEFVIDDVQSQNQNSVVSDYHSEQSYGEFYMIESSDMRINCLSNNILSHQNDFDSFIPEMKAEKTDSKVDKNDSKNVPKGMMKAFAHMVLDKKPQSIKIIKKYFDEDGTSYEKYKEYVRKIRKSSKISIQNIREMLLTEQFAVTTRKLGMFFIRKRFLSHIYNSKMEKRQIHLKYIPRWLEIFKDPNDFVSLK